MLRITQITIQEKNKERCNIFLDGEYSFSVSLELVLKYRLQVGTELSEKQIEEISFNEQKREALNKAIFYVSKTIKTRKQIKTYLYGKGYASSVVNFVVEKLQEYSYVNDVDYARQYIENCSNNQGRRLIEYKLMSKGISKEDIELAFSNVSVPQNENAKHVAEKYLKNKELTKENLAKAFRYLISRGFSYEEVDYALKEFKEN